MCRVFIDISAGGQLVFTGGQIYLNWTYKKNFPLDGQTMLGKPSSQLFSVPGVWSSIKPLVWLVDLDFLECHRGPLLNLFGNNMATDVPGQASVCFFFNEETFFICIKHHFSCRLLLCSCKLHCLCFNHSIPLLTSVIYH